MKYKTIYSRRNFIDKKFPSDNTIIIQIYTLLFVNIQRIIPSIRLREKLFYVN